MTTDLITADPALVVAVPMMDADEAREALVWMRVDITRIDETIASFRQRALDFAEREGWRALGYPNVADALNAELGTTYSKSYLSRLLGAARIERVLELPAGNSPPEKALRPLGQLDTPDQQRQAWQAASAAAGGTPTERHVRQAVQEIKPTPPPPLDELLGRLDVLGYTRVGAPRVKGMTTYHSFLEQGTGEELELAEGELSYWLTELEEREAARAARRAEYEDAQARFARLGYTLTRKEKQFALFDPRGARYAMTADLAPHLRTLATFEAGAATRAAETAAPAATDDDLADVRGVGDRAAYEAQEAADQRRLTEAEHLIGIGQYAAARGSLDEVRVATWRRDQLLATIPAAPTPTPTPAPADAPQRLACTTCGETLLNGHFAGQCGPCYRGERLTLPRDPRGRAIVLLRALEAVLPKLPKPESLEDLSVAISDLNECTEGDEATHWLRVGWALLDMIADEVAT